MDENIALTVRESQPMTLQETMTLGDTLFQSGYFSDAKSAAQAVVKILAGRELGFGPIASMTGLYVQGGRVCLSANLIAAQVKNSGLYAYKIVELGNDRCEIAFFENGSEMNPRSIFTMQDAKTAGLTSGKNAHSWKHYPRNMLFARAISNGVRWHCPELFSGSAVYTPDELDLVVDSEGEIINITPEPTSTTAPTKPKHWIESENVRKRFWAYANVLTLSDADVHAALEVEHVGEYAGTMPEAKAALDAYISDRIAETDEAEAEGPPPNADDLKF